ncbi:hypothetical protein DSO57_1006406 [Entomophthora muscae]|uniref:Uncharacterized protein n=1 Tax=Entomophthora muscae TaxID=34485 RepID=A0ACC2TIY5_9FUNG|nr:hypothetical protein DSO57_1006406 [Entomophthora muscae]
MITVPIGSVIAGLNFGALAHQIGNLFPVKWVPDTDIAIRLIHVIRLVIGQLIQHSLCIL